jgi:hypothetical protein
MIMNYDTHLRKRRTLGKQYPPALKSQVLRGKPKQRIDQEDVEPDTSIETFTATKIGKNYCPCCGTSLKTMGYEV